MAGTFALLHFVLRLRASLTSETIPMSTVTRIEPGYCAGFALRTPVRHNPNDLGLFIAMQLLTVTLPATFLAFNYIVYGRFVRNRVGPGYSFINPRKIALVFVLSDISTFMVQVWSYAFCFVRSWMVMLTLLLVGYRVLEVGSRPARAPLSSGRPSSSLASSCR